MYKLSHIQIKVSSIGQAIRDFQDLGFTVERGGKHSKNAFIWFERGPFIELLEMQGMYRIFGPVFGLFYGKAMHARWRKWCAKGEGMIDFAIEPSDAKRLDIRNFGQVRREAAVRRLSPAKVITWSRTNLRGEKVRFSYLPLLPVELPFLVSAYDTPQRPVKVTHQNGAEQIERLVLRCTQEQQGAFRSVTRYDPSIVIKRGRKFEIAEIVLKGLEKTLPKERLHGAVMAAEHGEAEGGKKGTDKHSS